jgi:hypothetical protein
MRCPTCSSPLPDGAMFCGQCGRAISTADVAAFRSTEGEFADTEVPAWRLQEPPAAAVPAGTPWWVSGRDEPEPSDDRAAEGASTDAEADAVDFEAAEEHALPDRAAPDDEASPTDVPAPAAPAAPAAARGPEHLPPVPSAPAALRPPAFDTAQPPRPTSAPLWTASLSPVTSERLEPASESIGEADALEPGEAAVTAASLQSGPGDAADESSAPSDVSPTNGEGHAPVEPRQQPSDLIAPPVDVPFAGDTNVIAPLVSPAPQDSSASLRCTFCGAHLAEDDIFCGECGAVVQSVAQSFTGPIVPILTGLVPAADPLPSPGDTSSPRAEQSPEGASADEKRADVTPAEAVPASTMPKKKRRFGRRAADESPELWSAPSAPESGTPAPAQRAPVSEHAPSRSVPPEGLVPAALERPGVDGAPEEQQSRPDRSDHAPVRSSMVDGAAAAVSTSEDVAPEPPIRASQVPHAVSVDETAAPVDAPLAPTPVAAPQQSAEPVLAPTPPAPESVRHVTPWATVGAAEDDVEKTRIVSRAPLGESFVLQFSTGESFTVQGTGLVGRAPTPQPGEAIDLLVRIVDPGKSVSKTHLEFGQEGGSLWVSDRWSGNGSVVREPSGPARRCEPGKRIRVARGSRIDIGEQFFIVS